MADDAARSPAPLPRPPELGPQRLCASSELADAGRAVVFDVRYFHAAARAFALRFEGHVVAYLNRCAHVPTELDWQPGEFLDDERRYIICAIHGATYEPRDGRCAGGPCGSGRLVAIATSEAGGQVYWQPTRDVRPDTPAEQPSTLVRR